jgi:hypothetical protein
VPQTSNAALKIWRAHKQALILGGLALAAAAGAAALAGLKPRISRFWTEVMAEVAARQVAGEFSPTGAVAVIVDSNGRV